MINISCKIFVIIYLGMFLNLNVFGQDSQSDSLNIAVSADAMNVLYIGLDNPISIAVSGYAADKIVAKISDGTIAKNGNNFIVNVIKRGEVNIEIYVVGNDSCLTYLGNKKFRVRNIPRPEAQLGTLQNGCGGSIATILANGTKVYASLGNNFVFEGIKYNVTEFTFTIAKKIGESKAGVRVLGNRLNYKCRELVKDIQTGDKILLDGIRVEGPGGDRILAPIIISVR